MKWWFLTLLKLSKSLQSSKFEPFVFNARLIENTGWKLLGFYSSAIHSFPLEVPYRAQPQAASKKSYTSYFFDQVFTPGTIRRHFYQVPDKCTYAVVKINSNEKVNQVRIPFLMLPLENFPWRGCLLATLTNTKKRFNFCTSVINWFWATFYFCCKRERLFYSSLHALQHQLIWVLRQLRGRLPESLFLNSMNSNDVELLRRTLSRHLLKSSISSDQD